MRSGIGIESAVLGPSFCASQWKTPPLLVAPAPFGPLPPLLEPPSGTTSVLARHVPAVLADRRLERARQILAQRPVDDLVLRDLPQRLAVAVDGIRLVDAAVDVPVVDQRLRAAAHRPRLGRLRDAERSADGCG